MIGKHSPFLFLGTIRDPTNAMEYVINTLDEHFAWSEPNPSSSADDCALDDEKMSLLLWFITTIAPIVLILVGNETSGASRRAKYFVENLPFMNSGYVALVEYERENGQIEKNAAEILQSAPPYLKSLQLQPLAAIVGDTRFRECLSKSRESLNERNERLTHISTQWGDETADNLPVLSDEVEKALLPSKNTLMHLLPCLVG